MGAGTQNTDTVMQDTESGQEDRTHWGGFRVGDEVSPLQGDAGRIMQTVAAISNRVVQNPQMPKPQAPQLTHGLQMAPPAPSMGHGAMSSSGTPPRLGVPANATKVQVVPANLQNDTE